MPRPACRTNACIVLPRIFLNGGGLAAGCQVQQYMYQEILAVAVPLLPPLLDM